MAQNELKFASKEELYQRILPALNTKVNEFKREKFNVDAIDIWNYCLINKWQKKTNLQMYELVSDILSIDILNLELFLKKNKQGDL